MKRLLLMLVVLLALPSLAQAGWGRYYGGFYGPRYGAFYAPRVIVPRPYIGLGYRPYRAYRPVYAAPVYRAPAYPAYGYPGYGYGW